MISFTHPIWLYGLLGLLIPIGIHLLSRKEGKTIYIGSIRHLTDSDTAQFSSIRLNEILLLILRLLLLTILVFILAGFSLNLKSNNSKRWLVIEKGIEKETQYRSIIDSLTTDGFEVHWLMSGFPVLKDSATSVTPTNYYKLLTDIESQADTAVVMSYGYANRFKGEKISLPPKIKWLSIEPRESNLIIQATAVKGDSVVARLTNSNSSGTSLHYRPMSSSDFEKAAGIDSLQLLPPDTIDIAIVNDLKFDYDKKIILASIQAIANNVPQKFKISTFTDPAKFSGNPDFLFWLSDEQFTAKELIAFGYSPCTDISVPLLHSREESIFNCSSNQPFDWIISERLNEENALEQSLSFQLAQILLKDLSIYHNNNVAAADKRSSTTDAAFNDRSNMQRNLTVKEVNVNIEPALFTLLFLILIIERYVAFKRNQ